MVAPLYDPIESLHRRQRRARLLLLVVESLHYVIAALALLLSLGGLFSTASDMAERLGNWGVVSGTELGRLILSAVGLAYGVGTVRSARLIERRIRRNFSRAWATMHLFTVVGAPLALLTWAVLSLPSVRELYDGSAPPFEPRMRFPGAPLPVLPVAPFTMSGDSSVDGR